MASAPFLTAEEFEALRQFDTCMIANAIETFNVRLRIQDSRTERFAACSRIPVQWSVTR